MAGKPTNNKETKNAGGEGNRAGEIDEKGTDWGQNISPVNPVENLRFKSQAFPDHRDPPTPKIHRGRNSVRSFSLPRKTQGNTKKSKKTIQDLIPVKKSSVLMIIASAILMAGVILAGCTQDSGSSSPQSGTSSASPAGQVQASTSVNEAQSSTTSVSGTPDQAAPSGTPPAGMAMNGTRASGTPPDGAMTNGTHPTGTPPSGTMPSGTPYSGAPPSGTPPSGS